MKVQLSGFVNDLNNKCGDIVASHNRYGLYFRERKDTPKNNSPYWIAIKDQTAILRAAWALLLQSERDAWNTATKHFRRTDCFGEPYYQSGYNFFVGTNLNRWFCGQASLNLPPSYVYVPLFQSLSLTATSGPDEKLLYFTPAIANTYKVKLWITNGMSPGNTRAYHEYRLLTLLDDTFFSGDSIQTLYAARFDPAKSKGNKLFYRGIFVDLATGLQGQPIYGSTFIN